MQFGNRDPRDDLFPIVVLWQHACRAAPHNHSKPRSAEATAALDDCDREHRLSSGRRPTFLVYRVICADEDVQHKNTDDIGNLRVALNALVRVFRLR
jgi:hypothetical protein